NGPNFEPDVIDGIVQPIIDPADLIQADSPSPCLEHERRAPSAKLLPGLNEKRFDGRPQSQAGCELPPSRIKLPNDPDFSLTVTDCWNQYLRLAAHDPSATGKPRATQGCNQLYERRTLAADPQCTDDRYTHPRWFANSPAR